MPRIVANTQTPEYPHHHPGLQLAISYADPGSLKPYGRNARTHSKRQIEQIAASIRAFGFVSPVVVDAQGEIIAGHGRLAAAQLLGLARVPAVRLDHLDELAKRALRLADNKLSELAGWDDDLLSLEFADLASFDLAADLAFDLTITGFAPAEIDGLIDLRPGSRAEENEDEAPPDVPVLPASRVGDLWLLGDHKLICGDARDAASYAALLGDERATMGIHDAPYDLPVSGMISKRGRHREFVMGSGELGSNFAPFLAAFLTASTASTRPGGFQLLFMDWRHMGEMLEAGRAAKLDLRNLCVWNKGTGAMGALYRSQHELVFVFKEPSVPGANNVMLGKFGRNRTNVWDYPGASSLRDELCLHPTPKPVALVADAIRDVSNRGDIVLDAFSGSGTTIIACAKTGRRGRAIDLDPGYVDVGVERWQRWSGEVARHAVTGLTFAETAEKRRLEGVPPALPESCRRHVRVRHRAPCAA